ncbi:FAD-dependent oxidoreductase [Vibrio sp. kj40-1]|uniref:FAD-dependent oxidoreductase n=2 Tax=Vibrio algarum TaxID=3020714 RepID=A0ABT4YUF3_9VIBR|nr:FAD-dependent oxidoreductase [Vibrio sp. KJ40-1]
MPKKLQMLLVLMTLLCLAIYFDMQALFTLGELKGSIAEFRQWRTDSPVLVIGGFILLYVLVTTLSLPGSAMLTMTSGALFGLTEGVGIAIVASSTGALFAFLISRYLFRGFLEDRFPEQLIMINHGIEKEGAYYLLSTRLIPVFPFFIVNILMSVTAIRAWTFYWVSALGMIPVTSAYVNAGTQLSQIESVSNVLSLELILSFSLLGLIPFITKMVVNKMKKDAVSNDWTKPKKFDRNLIVIGAGAGGLVTSYIAAAVKAKVTLIEAGEMGGDCLNYGCVPSKAIIKSAKMANQFKNAHHYGLEDSIPQFSFKKVMQRVHDVVAEVAPHDSVERYTDLGVEVLKGYGRLLDPWTVEISYEDGTSSKLTARSIVIATGARPFVPPLPGIEETGYVTSDTLWTEFAKLDTAPEKLVVLGGGPIGSELAQSFARLGSNVTQIEMADRIMIREDLEVSEFATKALQKSGVDILTSHQALRCELKEGKKIIVVKHQDEEIEIEYDQLLCAVGRSARLEGYGLEELGIETNRTIVTNEYLETLHPNIFAAGDIVGPYQFTHVAAHQGWYAAVNALFGQLKKFKVDYRVIPWVTFIDPEVARVGINEYEAKEKGIDYEVTRFEFKELDRAITESSTDGFIKVITPKGKDKILGVTIVSEHAGDLIAEFVLAMKHGLGLNKILGTIHSYPTWAEANKYAAGEWKRAHAPQTILRLLEKYHTWRRG